MSKSAKKSEKIMCIWPNQKGEACPWKTVSKDCIFCKRHSIYDGIFTAEDVPYLHKCSGCKNMFKPENEEIKQCDKCKTRGTINREKDKKIKVVIKCQGFTQKKTPCPYQSLNNDTYCKNHQTYKRWKELTDSGQYVCKNWIRGCFETIDETTKACRECRDKEQANENKLNQTKRSTALDYNSSHTETKLCVTCNKSCDSNAITNDKCLECYNTYCKNEHNRNPRSEEGTLVRKITEYKKSAHRRGKTWNLSDECARNLFQSKCAYCDMLVVFNGIDRVDSSKEYTEDNCVSCCKYCNILKGSYSVSNFLEIVQYLLSANGRIDEIPNSDYTHLFQFSQNATYNRFIADTKSRKIHCELTEPKYNYIISQPCTYCKNNSIGNNGARGIDRIDSTIGYIFENVTPCCKTCNLMKNVMPVTDFFDQLLSVYKFRILHLCNGSQSIVEQIISLCQNTTVKPMRHERFFHIKDYYNDLTFGYHGCDIQSVQAIKVHLEFVQNKDQRDIWNYYRRNVSSLKKPDTAKLIGRQFHILVKDLTSEKYLGIISLSSDVYNLGERDRHIGWSFQDKETKLNNIMNISTCVPLQPFGYNFNGGKLMASLAFSLEIMTYYREKYDDSLLGIITTSLYGKSIQYDRLPSLKFIGFTKGNSVKDIPSEVTKICADYLKKEYHRDYPLRKKFVILRDAFDKLNISKEDFLQSNKKGIYFGYTSYNSKDILLGKKPIHLCPKYNEHVKSAEEISQWWIDRWAVQRFTNLTEKNKVQCPV